MEQAQSWYNAFRVYAYVRQFVLELQLVQLLRNPS